ncbi:hypothetical protein ACFWM2_17295, partial [Streptomyces sp. NPDC058371]
LCASDEAWEWLYEGRIETRRALLHSEPCTVTINQGSTRITWTARPVLFLPLAHRRGLELPSCAYDFKMAAFIAETISTPRTTRVRRPGCAAAGVIVPP